MRMTENGGRDQIEFVFDLTFEKILHIPKRANEIQLFWSLEKMKGKSSIAAVSSNVATWDANGVNSIKLVSCLVKEPSSSTFIHKSLILEIAAVHNNKIISTLSHVSLNLADYVLSIFDLTRPSSKVQIHEKMAHGCVACFGITAQFLRAKSGEWKPTNTLRDDDFELPKEEIRESAGYTSIASQSQKDDQKCKAILSVKKVQILGSIDEQSSMYIGDSGIELLLRIFSKYDFNRSGYFQIEQVACMLQEIGHSSVAQDLRSGKAALSQNLDIFSCDEGGVDGTLHISFSSFVAWISSNRLLSKLQVGRSIREATKESIQGQSASDALVPDDYAH